MPKYLFTTHWTCGLVRFPILRAVFIAAALSASPSALAAPRYIELTDGSVIRGEVIEAGDGLYRIRTQSMGELTLKESEIRTIGTGEPGSRREAVGDTGGNGIGRETAAIQRKILNDPALLNSITALKDDPAVDSIVHDPEIMRAIQAGDLGSLQKNKKIEQLLESPAIREIVNEFTK